MIFIAGAEPKTEKYRLSKTEFCHRCHNQSHWILQKSRYFITLFFLPVIPFKTDYLYYCSICGNQIILNKEEFDLKLQDGVENIK